MKIHFMRTASTLNRVDVQAVEEMLPIGEKTHQYISIFENKEMILKIQLLLFICADAVQTKNNERVFD